jgi:hypothetical protein
METDEHDAVYAGFAVILICLMTLCRLFSNGQNIFEDLTVTIL